MDYNVPEAVCRERLKTADEHFKRIDKRLEVGETKLESVEKAVILLTEISKQAKEDISDHDKRLATLEHRPSMFWDKVIFGIISAVVSGGVAVIFNLFS